MTMWPFLWFAVIVLGLETFEIVKSEQYYRTKNKIIKQTDDEINLLEERLRELEAALEIYAEERNWLLVDMSDREYQAFFGQEENVFAHDYDPWWFAKNALEESGEL